MLTPIEFKTGFIAKMEEWAGWKFSPGQEKFLYDELKYRNQSALELAAKKLVSEETTRPAQARIIQSVAKAYVPVSQATPQKTYEEKQIQPLPEKFIREVVAPSLEFYAHNRVSGAWEEAYAAQKSTWESQNGPLSSYPITDTDMRFHCEYFRSVCQAMANQVLAPKKLSAA